MSGVVSFLEKQRALNQFDKVNDDIQLKTNPNGFAKLWRNPDMQKQLEEAIRAKMDEGKMKRKSINEKMLIDEYWRQWLEIGEEDHQTQLLRHPGLIRNDYQSIQNLITNERARQFYYAIGLSLSSYAIYHLGLKKRATFYNFFKNKSKYRVVNYSKNFFGGLMLLWTWTLSLTYFYDKKIPTDIAKKGYFKNYKIIFEQVYV